jgi:4,5-DOPA dioxygenase extradiol
MAGIHDSRRMPAIFFGHGSPLIALEDNATTETWAAIAAHLPKPRAILCISAHWCTRGSAVTAMAKPKTLHDFGGFPQALYDLDYPAPGDPGLAARVRELLAPVSDVRLDENWGLDHGAWSVLMKAYPQADIPIVQFSLDVAKTPAQHYEIGRRLRPLRDEGVLIVGTGNVVHNLKLLDWNSAAPPFAWATRFQDFVRDSIAGNAGDKLINYRDACPDAPLAVPSPDHYWPLLYVMGARSEEDAVSFSPCHIEHRSLSMMTVVCNPPAARQH